MTEVATVSAAVRLQAELGAFAESCIAELLSGGWTFAFDRARRRAGACDYTRRRLTVSVFAVRVATPPQLRQIVLHEVAHALAGPAAGHGPAWLSVARSIGYAGGRTTDFDMGEHFAPWVGTCPAGHVHYRFRAPRGPRSCGVCASGFDRRYLLTWRRRSVPSV